MNRTETRQRLIELGIAAERLPIDGQFNLSRADLSWADLSWANLSRANLSRANLSGADLSEANLSGADLSWAHLSWADLSGADLSGADLSGPHLSRSYLSRANLSGADLSGTDLSRANLSGTDLSRANLSWADLSGAIGPFTTGSFGQHTAIAAGGYIAIGCERHDYECWLSNYEACGQRNGYTPEEIAGYGAWIALAVARQRRIEQQPETAS